MDKLIVISAVRDFAMYERCIAANPHVADVERITFDNREKNEPIPVLYNRFLDAYDYTKPVWFVFCHEDFQPLERLAPLLETADTKSLWGPVGACTTWRWGFDPHYQFCGKLEQCNKDGGEVGNYGREVSVGTPVETFDCQCVIVHSSLVQAHRLRFDPRFAFDLYAEDFCVAAGQLGIASRILPFKCRHWSKGTLGARYYAAERAFAAKWPAVCCTGTSSEVLGGHVNAYRRMMLQLKRAKRKFATSKSLTGMSWSLAGKFAVKAVQFGFSIVLARLLCPSDFGLVGMIAIFMALANVLMDGGLVAALVRKKNRTEEDFSTVFWSKLAVSGLIYAVLFVCAPLVATFYARPELSAIMRTSSIGLILVALSSVFNARLVTSYRFRDLALVSTLTSVLSGAVGVMLAWRGMGVWAVVGQGLAWQVLTLGALTGVNRWLPKRCFSFASLRGFFDFGWKHLVRGLLGTVYGNIYSVVIGKGFGAADLGFYNRANYYTSEIGGMVGGVVNEVNYPLLSQLQNDAANLRRSYRRLQALIAAVMIPGMAVFAIFAKPIIRLIIGEQWIACVPYLQVLAIGAALSPLVNLANTLLYVKGRTDLALKIELVTKPIGFALLLAAIPFGILALCVASSVTMLLSFVIAGLAARGVLETQVGANALLDASAKKRLLVLGLGFERGGIVTTFKAMLPAFRAAGCDVRILAPYADEIGKYDIPKELVIGAAFPHRVRSLFFGRILRAFHWMTGWRFYFLFARTFPHDAFMVYGASLAPEWVRYSKCPTWGILHCVPNVRLDTFLTPVIRRGMRCLSRAYVGLFAATPAMQEVWQDMGVSSKVLIMPDPFIADRASVICNAKRQATKGEPLSVVCVGRLSWEKGQDLLIRALAFVSNVHVTFVGDGSWQGDLERIAEACGVRERITFAGWHENPLTIIRNADLLVNCSRTEAGSLAIREAFMCGVPVLVTDCPGNRWSVADGAWGRIVPCSDEALAEGLRHACDDLSWCLPTCGFDAIMESLAEDQRQTLEFVSTFDWTKR